MHRDQASQMVIAFVVWGLWLKYKYGDAPTCKLAKDILLSLSPRSLVAMGQMIVLHQYATS